MSVAPESALPVAAAVPVEAVPVAAMPVAALPTQGPMDSVPLLDAVTAGILMSVNSFTIKQRVKWWEALSGGCCEQANTYDIFDEANGAHLFIAQEISEDCARCFCAPHHSVKVEFRLVNNPQRQWNKGAEYPVVMTFERGGCCSNKPCVACYACNDSCKEEMYLQAGEVTRDVETVGITPQTIGMADQPGCGGYCTPSLNLLQRSTAGDDKGSFQPIAKVEGPCIFGGCSELCCSSEFKVSSLDEAEYKTDAKKQLGDLATITKKKPRSFKACPREMFTDSDVFTVTYKEGVGLTPQQKATMMGSVLLMDYMLFEQDNGMCESKNQSLYITLFDCYCCGVTVPCQIELNGNNGGG